MVVLIDRGQFESVEGYTKDGRFNLGGEESPFDLVNYETVTIPECWVVWWPIALNHTIHSSLDSCEGALEKGAILVKHIPAEEREV